MPISRGRASSVACDYRRLRAACTHTQWERRGIKGKTAVVTGSSEGLGRAILLRLAAEGANVVINYHRNEAAAEEVKAAAEAEGVRAIMVQADVSSVLT